jgi:hypothetical protein
MRIALITANIGGIDEVYPPAKQTEDYELFYYTENNLPFPMPSFDNRLKGKYLKTQAHRFLDHDIFIWIDGSVEIKDGTFLTWVLQELNDCDLIIQRHERQTVYEEIGHILEKMKKGSPYLLKRYARQPFKQEYDFYKSEGLNFPLYKCWFFACRNNIALNNMMNTWWDMILRYSNFDQSQFSYAAWKHQIHIHEVKTEDYLIRHKHQ